MDALRRDALTGEIHIGCGGRREEMAAQMVGQDPVNLFGHGAVERAHARLDMGNGDVEFRRCERAGQCAVGVAIDQHQIGSLVEQNGFKALQHAGGLGCVRPAADPE